MVELRCSLLRYRIRRFSLAGLLPKKIQRFAGIVEDLFDRGQSLANLLLGFGQVFQGLSRRGSEPVEFLTDLPGLVEANRDLFLLLKSSEVQPVCDTGHDDY